MPVTQHSAPAKPERTVRGTMSLLLFGVAVLAFLVAIGRPDWFHIRPATGSAVALSHAAYDGKADSRSTDRRAGNHI